MYTAEHINEFQLCINDPLYFISKYLINFEQGSDEKAIIDNLCYKSRNIIASHNPDIEYVLAAYVIWYAFFNSHKNIAIAAPSEVIAKEFVRKIYEMIDNLPAWIKPKYEEQLKRSCRFENGSRIVTGITRGYEFKGCSLSMLLWIEADLSKSNDQEEFYNCIIPALHDQSDIIITSSRMVISKGFFSKLFEGALNNKNSFNALQIG